MVRQREGGQLWEITQRAFGRLVNPLFHSRLATCTSVCSFAVSSVATFFSDSPVFWEVVRPGALKYRISKMYWAINLTFILEPVFLLVILTCMHDKVLQDYAYRTPESPVISPVRSLPVCQNVEDKWICFNFVVNRPFDFRTPQCFSLVIFKVQLCFKLVWYSEFLVFASTPEAQRRQCPLKFGLPAACWLCTCGAVISRCGADGWDEELWTCQSLNHKENLRALTSSAFSEGLAVITACCLFTHLSYTYLVLSFF